MKKLIAFAFALLIFCPLLHGATWFATSSSVNIDTAGLWVPTQGASCAGSGTALVWGAQANGDTFNANGCTALAVDVDPGSAGVEVTLTTDGTNGGGFTYATATALATIHANIKGTKTNCLVVSGSTSGTLVNIIGNITGGDATNVVGVSDTHTVGTMVVTGNVTGGTTAGGSEAGYNFTGATGSVTVNGQCIAGSTSETGCNLGTGASSSMTVMDCVGSDTTTGNGCSAGTASLGITVTGNLINGKVGPAVLNHILWVPSNSSKYVIYPKDSSYTLGVISSHATVMNTVRSSVF